jgi:hypothetical protein
MVALSLYLAAPATADLRLVDDLQLEDYSSRGAVGLAVVDRNLDNSLWFELVRRLPTKVHVQSVDPPRLTIDIGKPGAPTICLDSPRPIERGDRLPVAVVGDGYRGVLTSDSTRIDGLVTLDDVIEGNLDWHADNDAVATVERLDDRIVRNDDLRLLFTILVGTVVIALAIVRPQLAPRALLVALALNLWLSPALAVAGALAAVALPLGWACAALLAVYCAALGLDAETVALSPLGPSQVGRFYGVNNLIETFLLLPAFLGAALLGRLGVAVAALAIVTIAGNRFGADGGGLVVLLAGYAVLALRLMGGRITRRRALLLGAGVLAAALVLVGLDAATGGSSHVTDAVSDGPGDLAAELGDRIERSVTRTLDSAGPLGVVLASLAVLGWTVTKRGEPVLDALLVALAVSLVVNDTPSDVLSAGAVAAVTLVRLRAQESPETAPVAGFEARAWW